MTDQPTWPKDPLLRALRALSVVAFLALLALLITREQADSTIVGFLVGAILIQLCYDALVGVPGIISKRGDPPPKEGPHE